MGEKIFKENNLVFSREHLTNESNYSKESKVKLVLDIARAKI